MLGYNANVIKSIVCSVIYFCSISISRWLLFIKLHLLGMKRPNMDMFIYLSVIKINVLVSIVGVLLGYFLGSKIIFLMYEQYNLTTTNEWFLMIINAIVTGVAISLYYSYLDIENKTAKNIEKSNYIQNITVKDAGIYKIINVHDIDYFISRDHYTCIFSKSKEYITKLSLENIISKLDPKHFIRIHRASIVKISTIKNIDGPTIITKSGEELKISRRNKKIILNALKTNNNF